jgi:hypothetical protein
MVLLGISALVLAAGLQMQPQTAAPAAPVSASTTEVMVITSLKPGTSMADVAKIVSEEVRTGVQLYLDGKIEQWYTRTDGKGAVLLLRCKTIDEAKEIINGLPAVKAGYLNVEYIPLGPFTGLRRLMVPQPPAEGTAPH